MKWISMKQQRPTDKEKILYYFEPFGSIHIGQYNKDTDSVYGNSGFTSVCPEVPTWCNLKEVEESIPKELKEYFNEENN